MYITKAAARREKLYKDIEQSLEDQHESILAFTKSLSPPDAARAKIDISRPSPFGSLSQPSSRRTFAYMVATLNASHEDYEFSQVTKPADFKHEKSLRSVMARIDDALYTLRPRGRLVGRNPLSGSQTPGGSQMWNPSMWRSIDKEMSLQFCDIYQYLPDVYPFDDEEPALWSHHYFFFNKDRKRVCYLFFRGVSNLSHSLNAATPKRPRPISSNSLSIDAGASKRARYWLGDRAEGLEASWDDYDDDQVHGSYNDEMYGEDRFDEGSAAGYSSNEDEDELEQRYRARNSVRHMSEHVMESMDV